MLYARGTDIRPVLVGASWHYHRRNYQFGGTSDYVVTSTAGTGSQVTETDSSHATNPTTVTVAADGSVSVAQAVVLTGTQSLALSGLEVRSPVQVNDQYVIYDASVPNLDLDGDGRADAAKLALWRRVIGNEAIQLPNRPTTTQTLRIDTFIALDATPSSGGAEITVSTQSSTWYEPGVGVVRQTVGSAPTPAIASDDVLTGWDGVTEGRGYITQAQQRFGGGGFDIYGRPFEAVGFVDGALVYSSGRMVRLDKNGLVVSSAALDPAAPTSFSLYPTAAGIRAIGGTNGSDLFAGDIHFDSFSDRGEYLGRLATVNVANGRPQTQFEGDVALASSADSPVIWLGWLRQYAGAPGQNAVSEIVLRGFGPDGSTVVSERTFPVDFMIEGSSLRLTVQASAVVATWTSIGFDAQTTARTARVTNQGSVSFDTSPITLVRPQSTPFLSFLPASDGDTTWLAWVINSSTNGGSDLQAFGVRLDDSGTPLASTAGSNVLGAVTSEPLSALTSTGFAADSGHLFAAGPGFGLAFPTDQLQSNWMTVVDYDAGAGALAETLAISKQYRVPNVAYNTSVKPIFFPDRVLLLTTDLGGTFMQPTVIFR